MEPKEQKPVQERRSEALRQIFNEIGAELNYDPLHTSPQALRERTIFALNGIETVIRLLVGKGLLTKDEYEAAEAAALENTAAVMAQVRASHGL